MYENYDKNIESSYIKYLDANNLCGWVMSQKLPVNGFRWVNQKKLSNFSEDFIKNYDENSKKVYFLKGDIDYPKKLFNLYKDLPFLPESEKVNKVEKLISQHRKQRKIYYSHKIFKTSIKSWVKTKKGA